MRYILNLLKRLDAKMTSDLDEFSRHLWLPDQPDKSINLPRQ